MLEYMTTTTKSIGEIMTKKFETIAISNSAQEAAKKMRDKNVSSLLVIDDNNNTNRPLGIVTERDLVRKVCVNDASSKHTMVQEVASSPLMTIDAISSVEVAAHVMTQNKVRHLL
jgi:signal-transduction protein with cAMP-binding, CBS, and nucleotidyltransferase domain